MRIRYITFGLVPIIILLFVTTNHALNVNKPEVYPQNMADFIINHPLKKNTLYSIPPVSGSVAILPWENDPDFQIAVQENNTNVQLANYCTVLKDPLPGEETNVHIAASILKGTIVKPGHIFSQNANVGPYNQSKGFQKGPVYIGSQLKTTIGGGVCKIASTLYNVAILSDLTIVERYAHSMPVPYVPLGQDATVCYGVKDFKFLNNTPYPILIWAEGIDNRLYIAFYGQTVSPKVQWHHEIEKHIKTYKIFRQNYSIEAGTEEVVMEGMDGAIVRSWLTIQDPRESKIITKKLGKDYYNPMPSVIEQGMMEPNPASSY